jgi:hypothetical protein
MHRYLEMLLLGKPPLTMSADEWTVRDTVLVSVCHRRGIMVHVCVSHICHCSGSGCIDA